MKEIERKFLINTNIWKPSTKGHKIKQGYLSADPKRTVRVRIMDDDAFITIKGENVGIVRTELEYQIPKDDAEILMEMSLHSPIEKTRYKEEYKGKIWEIDIFEGLNKGLIVAEIELEDENESFEEPEWLIEDVSLLLRYSNSNLSKNPYSKW